MHLTPWLRRRRALAVTALVGGLLLLTPAAQANGCAGDMHELFAGQDIDVGYVCIDADNVTIATDDGWFLVESHVDRQEDPGDFPTTKKGNPKVGQFAFSDDHGAVTSWTYDTSSASGVYFAVHAAVEKIDTGEVLEAGPRWATGWSDEDQGDRKDGTPVLLARSDPNQALGAPDSQTDNNFYSLGFGGTIVLTFDCAVPNLDGDDLTLYEVTGGSYPTETASVEVWDPHAGEWVLLGEADNQPNPVPNRLVPTSFDLGDVQYTSQVRITDTSDPDLHTNGADGFDIDSLETSAPCHPILSESAWGDGADFEGRNWATYIGPEPPADE